MDKYFYFDDIFQDYTKYSLKIPKNMYLKSGLYPIIDQGKEEIAGYSDKNINIFDKIPVIIFGDHTRIFKYVDYPFFLGADGVKILKNTSSLFLDKYLYYSLKNFKIPNTGYNRHFKWLKDFKIKHISLAKQEKIVSLIEKIEYFILKKKEQLKYLKKLNKSLFTKYSNSKIVKSFYIKDISSELFAGGDKPNDYSENISKEYIYPVYSNGEKKEGLLCFSKTFKVDKEALTISARGTIGFITIRKAYFTPVVRLITLIPNKNNNIIYLKYAIGELNLKKLGSGVAQLTIPVFSKYKLNLPPIELQNKFAKKIEKIEKLSFEIEKSIKEAENLYNSLINKYFE